MAACKESELAEQLSPFLEIPPRVKEALHIRVPRPGVVPPAGLNPGSQTLDNSGAYVAKSPALAPHQRVCPHRQAGLATGGSTLGRPQGDTWRPEPWPEAEEPHRPCSARCWATPP